MSYAKRTRRAYVASSIQTARQGTTAERMWAIRARRIRPRLLTGSVTKKGVGFMSKKSAGQHPFLGHSLREVREGQVKSLGAATRRTPKRQPLGLAPDALRLPGASLPGGAAGVHASASAPKNFS